MPNSEEYECRAEDQREHEAERREAERHPGVSLVVQTPALNLQGGSASGRCSNGIHTCFVLTLLQQQVGPVTDQSVLVTSHLH